MQYSIMTYWPLSQIKNWAKLMLASASNCFYQTLFAIGIVFCLSTRFWKTNPKNAKSSTHPERLLASCFSSLLANHFSLGPLFAGGTVL